MEVIKKPMGGNIDEMAEKVFMESIKLLGGLKKLIEYRNLTWLPSLAEAAYVIILKNEAIKTYAEIASILGITEQTAKNIATADEEKVKEYIMGGQERPNEHIAGGLAKLAYKKLSEGGLSVDTGMREAVADIAWAVHVLSRIKGVDFPAGKEELMKKLEGIKIRGKNIEELLEKIEYPVENPAQLLHKIKENL